MLEKFVTFFNISAVTGFLYCCSGSQYEDNAEDNLPKNDVVATPLEPVLLDNGIYGYAVNYNATLVVESLDSYEWDPRFN